MNVLATEYIFLPIQLLRSELDHLNGDIVQENVQYSVRN